MEPYMNIRMSMSMRRNTGIYMSMNIHMTETGSMSTDMHILTPMPTQRRC